MPINSYRVCFLVFLHTDYGPLAQNAKGRRKQANIPIELGDRHGMPSLSLKSISRATLASEIGRQFPETRGRLALGDVVTKMQGCSHFSWTRESILAMAAARIGSPRCTMCRGTYAVRAGVQRRFESRARLKKDAPAPLLAHIVCSNTKY
jgi:hypothetical protein